jgi:nucleotide-binding universal stress UspA family protein
MVASKIRSVLVASDLKEGSDTVMESASVIATVTGADLHAVHAIELPPLEYSSGRSLQNDILSAEGALAEQAVRCAPRGDGLRSRSATILAPHRAIIERAIEVSADLIVLGPHKRVFGLGVLGTTADRVARRGIAPCLIVKRALSLPLRKVVAGDDFQSTQTRHWTRRLS